jgi:hypothetical protein
VEFVEYPDGLEVSSRHVGARLNASTGHKFEVHVPHRFNVDVRSAGGGVALTEVQGNFTGETGGGALSFTKVRGEARLTTGGGAIAISDSHLGGEVRTGGGAAALRNTTGDVRVHSGSGGIVRGNSSLPASEVVRIHREGGDIDVPRAPAGAEVFTAGGAITIGTSGGPVRAQTGGGAIRVRSAVDLVKLGTGGGAITVDAVDGGIAATTGAGAVVATMVGNPARGDKSVEIRSGSGAVVLTLPDGIGATFDIEAAYPGSDNNGRTTRPVRITSDFPLQQNERADADGAGYRVRATWRVADGRNRVYIRTVGDVHIQRASGRTSASTQAISPAATSTGFAFVTGDDVEGRARAVRQMALSAPPRAAAAALGRPAFSEPDARTRREAVEGLLRLPDGAGDAELARIAATHPDPVLRERARRERAEAPGIGRGWVEIAPSDPAGPPDPPAPPAPPSQVAPS